VLSVFLGQQVMQRIQYEMQLAQARAQTGQVEHQSDIDAGAKTVRDTLEAVQQGVVHTLDHFAASARDWAEWVPSHSMFLIGLLFIVVVVAFFLSASP